MASSASVPAAIIDAEQGSANGARRVSPNFHGSVHLPRARSEGARYFPMGMFKSTIVIAFQSFIGITSRLRFGS